MSPFVMLAALAIQTNAPAGPASAEAAAVLAPINATFAALAARDATMLAPHFDPEARMTVVVERPGGERVIAQMTLQEFVGGLTPGPERYEEVMPDPTIAIDGDVAMVWGFYLFKVDGAIVHCGSDHFDMIRREGVWVINAITWNQRTEGCAA
jgi:hypothetical protein